MRLLRDLHRWVGALLAVVIAAVALSGALLVARDPYYRWRFPAIVGGVVHADRDALTHVEQTLARELGERRLRVLRLPHAGLPAFQAWFDHDTEALITPDGLGVLDSWQGATKLVPFVFGLHAHLLGGDTGSTVNGLAALLLVALVTSGLVAWWPRRTSFPVLAVRPGNSSRGALLRSHVAVGTLLALPILFFAATGATLVFNGPVTGWLGGWLDAAPAKRPDARVARLAKSTHTLAALAEVARRSVPDGELTMYMPGSGDNAVATFRLRTPGEWHPNGRTYVLVDPYTAEVVQQIDARQQGLGTRIGYAIYPLHAARGSGEWIALPAVIAGLGLTWVSLGGIFTFLRRGILSRRSSPAGRQRKCSAGPAWR